MDLSFIQADAKHSQDTVSDSPGGEVFFNAMQSQLIRFYVSSKDRNPREGMRTHISGIHAEEGEWSVVCVRGSIFMHSNFY